MADSIITVPTGRSNPELVSNPASSAPVELSPAPQPDAPSVKAAVEAPAAPPVEPVNDNDAMADAAVQAVVGESNMPSIAPNAMQASIASAIGTNPDAEAEARRVALRTGVPIQTVFAKPDEMKRKDALSQIDFDNFKQLYPTTAAILADVEVAKIAHDDINNMGYFENTMRGIGGRAVNLSGSLARFGYGVNKEIARAVAPELTAYADSLPGLPGTQNLKAVEDFDLGYVPRTTWEDVKNRPLSEFLPFAIEQGLISAPDMAAAIFVPGAYFPALTGEFGQNRAENDERPEATVGDFISVAPAAVANALLERFGAKGIIGAKGVAQGFKQVGKAMLVAGLKEGATEAAQNASQYTAETAGTKKGFDIAEAGEQALQGAVAGGPFGTAASGVSHGVRSAVERTSTKIKKATAAEQNALDFEKMNVLAAESKLKQRDPLAFQNFIQQVAETEGALENVYLDPRALAQSGINLEELAAISPTIADQMRVSLETGSDMQIPVSEYASHLAGTELGEAMIDHLKTDPFGMSRIESREFMQGHAEELQAAVEKAVTEQVNDDSFTESANNLRTQLTGQLKTAGRFTDDVNTQYATLLSEFYKVQAAKMGVTPEELFKQHPLEIKSVFDRGSTLDQKTPEFQNWFGESKVVDKDGAPIRMYHGTGGWEIEKFKSYRSDLVAGYFTPNEKFASDFAENEAAQHDDMDSPEWAGAHILPVYLRAAKPWDYTNEQHVTAVSNALGLDDAARAELSTGDYEMVEREEVLREIRKQGFDAFYVRESGSSDVKNMGVFSAEQIKSVFNEGTFDRNNANILKQGETTARGSFNPDTNTITLLRRADLSTFLHESGHFFLEVMNKLALNPNSPQSIKDDMQATLDWMGVKGIAEWNSHDLEWQRDKHEQFARGFEAYLFEGKSPSIEMRSVFQRFRAWMLNVYRSLTALNVELTDEVRAVFDRMLATNDQIKETELARNFEPMFSELRAAGMDKTEWQQYQELGIQATQDAQAILEARSMRDMKYLSNAKSRVLKDLQREAAGRRREVRDAVTKEVMAEPVNQAREFLKHGRLNGEVVEDGTGTKLSIPEIEAMYGDNPIVGLIKRELGHGKYGMIGVEKGIHPDQAAEMFGYSSGDELVRDLLGAEKSEEKIAGLTDQRMLEKYGDLTDPDVLSVAADEAIHNEVRARFVATELNALQKATGGKKILAEAARRYANDMISRLKIKDVRPSRYAAAEARAARAAAESFKVGGLAAAAVEKRNQLIQNYAARAAHDALAEADKAVRYFNKFSKPGTRENIATSSLDQIDALLERFDLRKSVTKKELERRQSLLKWVAEQEELGIVPEIPQELLEAAERKSYKDMTVEEMRGLRDTIKQIEHIGRLKNKLLTAKDERDFASTVAGIVASIDEHGAHRIADNRTRPNTGDLGKRLFKGFVAQHRKVASLVKELDGFKDGGPMWDTFVRTMNEAGAKEATMRATATKKLAELVAPILDGKEIGGKGLFFPSVGQSFNREARIGIALNTGNAGNFQRLLDGEGWTKEQVAPILDTLTKADWDFVQNVWDFFESYRPEVGAKEKRILGTQPKWIEPQPVHTSFGEYRGGYYPIKYDPGLSIRAEQHADAEAAKAQMKGAYTSSTTRRSFTKTRAEEVKGRPLLYSMDGLYQGTNEIIHDLSWHEWLIDANRLLKNNSLDGAIRNHYGKEVVKQFKTAVEDIAAGENPGNKEYDAVLNHLRTGASVAGLGINVVNSVINMTGAMQSIERIGPKWMLMGVTEWTRNPRDLTRRVAEKSDMMANRAQTLQREINEIQSVVRGKSTVRQVMDQVMYLPMQLTQIAVDTPTWWGAYQKALTEGHDESKSVALADQSVLDAQGGGQIKDLAAIQRGGSWKKLFTTFYSYFSTTYNLSAEAARRTNFKDPQSVLRLAGSYLLLYSIPAALGTLIKTALTGDEDDWKLKKVAKTLANDQLSYALGTVVGVREMTGAIQRVAGVSEYNVAYGGPAGLRFLQELDKLATQIHQGEADEALFKSVSNILGIIFHLPSTQINRTILGGKALVEGETLNPAALVAGPPKK